MASKTRVLIVGGGGAGLSAAWKLSSPEFADAFSVELYQMGWRLGGKGASSRQVTESGHIFEHGLHVLGGFYHNTNQMMRRVYDEWSTLPDGAAISFDEAFLPHNTVHLSEKIGGKWKQVEIDFPSNTKVIGEGFTELNAATILRGIIAWLASGFKPPKISDLNPPAFKGLDAAKLSVEPQVDAKTQAILADISAMSDAQLGDSEFTSKVQEKILKKVSELESLKIASNKNFGSEIRMNAIQLAQIGWILASGILKDGVVTRGFDYLNGEELKAWMRRHGANQDILDCCYTRSGYDYLFAYSDGDPKKPDLAAGVGLRGLLTILFCYHNTVFVHMNGSMGEIVFAPLYEVLKSRGVKFQFFHELKGAECSALSGEIVSLEFAQQANLKNQHYNPVFEFKGRHVWPEGPLVDQLENEQPIFGQDAEDRFESGSTLDAPKVSKMLGQDFDVVILAIPPDSIKQLHGNLLSTSLPLARAVATAHSVATVAIQVWAPQDTRTMGGLSKETILTTFAQPFATWADMSYLLRIKGMPDSKFSHLSYLCGTWTFSAAQIAADPVTSRQLARQAATHSFSNWWPVNIRSIIDRAPELSDVIEGQPSLKSYIRVNWLPSERYLLSRAGSIEQRIVCDGTGLSNLFLAGDWIRNGFDYGAFESAVGAGLQCARAISGVDFFIPGERVVLASAK